MGKVATHTYEVSEKFKSIQGEGLYTGTPMAFIRFVGCSVGKRFCSGCDTDFESMHTFRGGGVFTPAELLEWVGDYRHICLTGGEPLDQNLTPLLRLLGSQNRVQGADPYMVHIETSGTKEFIYLEESDLPWWVCVSPKPGFREEVVLNAHEIKIIVPGLGNITQTLRNNLYINPQHTPGYQGHPPDVTGPEHIRAYVDGMHWPTLDDALRWHKAGRLVYLQPRNDRFDVDMQMMQVVMDNCLKHGFRLSTQLHKIVKVQ